MSMLVWVMMAIAIWHFTVFVPDRFVGGIVGALLAAVAGAALFGWIIHGLSVPGQDDTNLSASLEAIPGALLGLGASYLLGSQRENAAGQREQRA